DSFFVSADGGVEDVYDLAEGTWSASWQWSTVNGRAGGDQPLAIDPRIFDLSVGTHTITFRARETQSVLDPFIITNDPSFVPNDLTFARSDPPAADTPPTVSVIADQSTLGNAAKVVSFTVGDLETPAGALSVTAASSNPTLTPTADLVLSGSGANRTLTITPA